MNRVPLHRTSWSEIKQRRPRTPEQIARIEEEQRAMLIIAALTELREKRALTQKDLAASLNVSQARVSHIERQGDLNLSTLDEYVRAMGGELRLTVVFPDETVELVPATTG